MRWCVYSITGLFVPLHFRSRERKDHRENFRSRGTFVPSNIRSRGAKSPRTFLPWNFRSSGANVPRTFVPWNFRTLGTFAPQTCFVPFNFRSYGLLAVITATRACMQQSCEATLISDNYTSALYTDGREVQKPVHVTIVITREAMSVSQSVSQSVSGTLDRPRVVAPSKTCGHVRSSRRCWR